MVKLLEMGKKVQDGECEYNNKCNLLGTRFEELRLEEYDFDYLLFGW